MHVRPLPPALDAAVPMVMRWCARLGGPRIDAEDAAQDVLEVALKRWDSLQDPTATDAWLFGITRRVLAAHRRRAWWRRWTGGVPEDRAAEGPDPEGATMRHQRAAQLQRWLETLPAEQREVIVLCSLEERSRAEVAAILGIPIGTVKSRLRLGMERLRVLARPPATAAEPA